MYFTFGTYYDHGRYVPVTYKNNNLFIQRHLYADKTIKTYRELDLNKAIKNKNPIFIKNCFLYSKRWDFNWRHFLIETFQTIHYYLEEKQKNPNLKLLVMKDASRWVFEIFKILDINDYICITKNNLIISERVIVKKNVYNQDFMDLFINNCKEMSNMVNCTSREKIYISRLNADKSKKRELINVDKFYNYYVNGKLYELFPEELKLWDQVTLINNAKLVLNLIGANCDNIIFANKDCKFIIIYPKHCSVWAHWYFKNSKPIKPLIYQHGCSVGKSTDRDPYNGPWRLSIFNSSIIKLD